MHVQAHVETVWSWLQHFQLNFSSNGRRMHFGTKDISIHRVQMAQTVQRGDALSSAAQEHMRHVSRGQAHVKSVGLIPELLGAGAAALTGTACIDQRP